MLDDNNTDGFTLTHDWYDRINAGEDIRDTFRAENLGEDFVRGQAAVLLVMYLHYPLPMTERELEVEVSEGLFYLMEDGAFQECVEEAVHSKMN